LLNDYRNSGYPEGAKGLKNL